MRTTNRSETKSLCNYKIHDLKVRLHDVPYSSYSTIWAFKSSNTMVINANSVQKFRLVSIVLFFFFNRLTRLEFKEKITVVQFVND